MLQIPHMNPFPGKNSVLVMDNARIHHNAKWISVIEELGGRVLFLPPYSPDFNPIKLAFSTIKAWLRICEITFIHYYLHVHKLRQKW